MSGSLGCGEVRLELFGSARGELDPRLAEQVDSHVLECASCRDELEELKTTMALLEKSAPEHAPEEMLAERIFSLQELDHVGRLIAAAPLEHDPPPELERRSLAGLGDAMRSLGRWPRVATILAPSLAATVIVLGVLGINWRSDIAELRNRLFGMQRHYGPLGQQMGNLELTSRRTPAGSARAEVYHSPHDTYRVVLYADNLVATPEGYHYELWLTGDEGRASAGSFKVLHPDETVVDFTVGVDPREYPHFEITLEPDDGRPTEDGPVFMEADYTVPAQETVSHP